MDYAGSDVSTAATKTVGALSPAIKKVAEDIGFSKDPEVALEKAKKMFDEGDITKEEYEALRKKILGL
jgi:uncharacterized membrane protein